MASQSSQDQISVWRSFLEVHSAVIKALEKELIEDQSFSSTWYDVLTHLSEAPGARMQHQALAGSLLLSRSGVTRLVDRMAEAGLVCRESSPEDRQVSYVVMTQPGRDALDRASPGHMHGIAQHFVRYLEAGDVALLQGFLSRVLDGESGG